MQATRKTKNQLVEFTGERVVPEMVEADLWNEHFSRYLYAAGLVSGKRVLDVGCGTGYGTACMAHRAALAVGFDVSAEAIAFARQRYGKEARFQTGSAESFPQEDGSFEVVTAFEVIEHLEDWRKLIAEASRVLADDGIFLVSTPNKTYYAETRAAAGPNPFHIHEFDYDEFRASLEAIFPHVVILGQNRTESITIAGEGTPGNSWVDFGRATEPVSEAHFYFAVCSKRPFLAPSFVFVPGVGNLLRERERHIALLEQQLEDANRDRTMLLGEHWRLEARANERTEWARNLESDLSDVKRQRNEALERLHGLEEELDKRTAWAKSLDEQVATVSALLVERDKTIEERTVWAQSLDAELVVLRSRIQDLVNTLDEREGTINERTEWARGLDRELGTTKQRLTDASQQLAEANQLLAEVNQHLSQLVTSLKASRWFKLGRQLGLGPDLDSLRNE